jgi:hypothetical protein
MVLLLRKSGVAGEARLFDSGNFSRVFGMRLPSVRENSGTLFSGTRMGSVLSIFGG